MPYKNNKIKISMKMKGGIFLSTFFLVMTVFFVIANITNMNDLIEQAIDTRTSMLNSYILSNIEDKFKEIDKDARNFIIDEKFHNIFKNKKIDDVQEAFIIGNKYFFGIDDIIFFDTSGNSIKGHMSEYSSEDISGYLKNAVKIRKSAYYFVCYEKCLLYTFIPVEKNEKVLGSVVFVIEMSDIIEKFTKNFKDNIVFLSKTPDRGIFIVPSWERGVSSMTNEYLSRNIISVAERTFQYADKAKGRVEWSRNSYSIRYKKNKLENSNFEIIYILDVSQKTTGFHNLIFLSLGVSTIIFIIAVIVLASILGKYSDRISLLSTSLPLLLDNKFANFKENVSKTTRMGDKFYDEVDELFFNSLNILSILENNLNDITDKNKELVEERDFSRGLLETANFIILTQTDTGDITNTNGFTSHITGFTMEELKNMKFQELIAYDGILASHIPITLNDNKNYIEIEQKLLLRNRKPLEFLWIHSKLKEKHADGSTILTIGIDINERVEAEKKNTWLAEHDALTELPNRHVFLRELERLMIEVERTNVSSAVLFFDIDFFKEINDTSGHMAGDLLLKRVANMVYKKTRRTDVIARLSGDEFAIILKNISLEGAKDFAEKFIDYIKENTFHYKTKIYKISVSMGLVMLPNRSRDAEEVLSKADTAMYVAKKAGRGQYKVFDELGYEEGTDERRDMWFLSILDAIENYDILLYIQPIVRLETGKIEYYEILSRLRDKQGKIISPVEFINVAIRAKLITKFDLKVLELTIKKLKEIYKNTGNRVRLSINLSSSTFLERSWIRLIENAVKENAITIDQIIIEITESDVISDLSAAKDIIDECRKIGIYFSIDDFGTGYASFSYLKYLDTNAIKIDSSFIKNIIHDTRDYGFVSAMKTLAVSYDKKIIAEGIEDQETTDKLKEIGVECGQGYYFGKPKDINEVFK